MILSAGDSQYYLRNEATVYRYSAGYMEYVLRPRTRTEKPVWERSALYTAAEIGQSLTEFFSMMREVSAQEASLALMDEFGVAAAAELMATSSFGAESEDMW